MFLLAFPPVPSWDFFRFLFEVIPRRDGKGEREEGKDVMLASLLFSSHVGRIDGRPRLVMPFRPRK